MYKGIKIFLNRKLLVALSIFFVGGHLVAQQPTGLAAIRERLLARKGLSPTVQPIPAPAVEPVQPVVSPVQSSMPPRLNMSGLSNLGQSGVQQPILQPSSIKPAMPAVSEEDTDEYVQTEALLQLPEVKNLMENFIMRVPGDKNQPEQKLTPNQMVAPYLDIITSAINKEVEFKNSHYVFYNGLNNAWRVPQDLYKQLHAYYKPLISVKDFVFVRFTDLPTVKVQDYLAQNLEEWAGVNDNQQAVRDVLISTNLSLFGNVGFPGECTWNYFLEPKSKKWPYPINFKGILDSFDLTYDLETLVKETGELIDMLTKASTEQTLIQFFIPEDKVDDVAYLSWILGFPAHPKSIELMEARIGNKPRVGPITGPVVKKVMKEFRKERVSNPIYTDLIKSAENGNFGIKAFMDIYRNNPSALENPNDTQARLLITKDILQNPNSGVKMFTYFRTPYDIQQEYLKKLKAIVKKIIDQEAGKTEEQKIADRAKNEQQLEAITGQRIAEDEAEKAASNKK